MCRESVADLRYKTIKVINQQKYLAKCAPMEANKRQVEMKLNHECVYVFETKGEMVPSKFRRKVWQILPSICATLMCLPFGIMLGWPSPTYPTLVQPGAPVWISMDQSAMVAGFLMIGNTVSTPFSTIDRIGAKYGIIIGASLITIGWILMWQARDIFWLLGSRFLIGAGNGFGTGQVKLYITEICQDSLAQTMAKQINLYVFLGVVMAFSYGPFVDFRNFSIINSILSVLVLFLAIFLPSTPRELVKSGKMTEARKLIAFLSPDLSVSEEIVKIKERINAPDCSLGFCDLVRDKSLRRSLVVFVGLVFFGQFSGAIATLVYSQMIFERTHCPRPEMCALAYALIFLVANFYGTFCVPSHNKKYVLLFSSIGVSVLLVLNIVVLVEELNVQFWQFTSLVGLLLYILVYTVGLGTVPVLLIPELFPKEANKVVVQFFVMSNSMLALTITKIFQVLFTNMGLVTPLCLFLTASTFSIIFVIIFVPNKSNNKSNNT
ncbi:solute carrier family 2, facilitated glucose transporter member 8 isoform X2 [Tribolium castaneum]|uniref:solute carrier family 2, facilitated glucose transporter member 8 isoform X2 n=1 Tax=Tribolium castaneum TaxID=7070 RepID=UPI00077DB39A|nr:PREDICTED: solute carrier family 2, facilitated glucose transporter member 8 isoform X2 [Tribolium castaneum]|eukprot:XP_015838532.1 PREDICTED: solute carrier family 2, facilitated glucose transporter member 8 isoform X2 [Tribolium castaneum]